MIDLPLQAIITRIQESSKLSEQAIKERIKKKLDEFSGLISEEGAAHIIANELGIKLHDPGKPLTVDKVVAGMRGVEITGKVRQIYEVREFSNERGTGKVANFLITDKTGSLRVVLWNNQADKLKTLKLGDVIKLQGAYARSNNGRVELHLGDDAKLLINPPGVTVDVDITAPSSTPSMTKRIAELTAEDQNVTVKATIVQVFDPRFFPACPECNGKVKEENDGHTCPHHGAVKPTYNYVMNVYLDDSSDNIRCVLWREQVDQLLGKQRKEVLLYKDSPASFEQQKTDLLGVILKVRGRVNQNETFGRLELVAYETAKLDLEQELAERKTTTPTKHSVTEREETTAEVKDDKVTKVTTKQETTFTTDNKEVFTLDDLEDLDD